MKKKVLFLGFYITKKKLSIIQENDELPPVQTFKFSESFLLALDKKYNLSIISAIPVSDYPYSSFKSIKSEVSRSDLPSGTSVNYISFINTPLIKPITRLFTSLYSCLRCVISSKPDYIMVYSVHLPFMVVGFLVSRIFNIKLVSVWTDPPALNNARDNFIKSKLRLFELSVSKFFMRMFDASIVLTKELANDFNPEKPYLVIESILKVASDPGSIVVRNNKIKTIMYAGSLNFNYGVNDILESLSYLEGEDVKIQFYGRGEAENYIIEKSKENESVEYCGFHDYNVIERKLREADFLINVRPQDQSFVNYSFPSKLTEYLSSGTPVILNKLSGIPEEYTEVVIFCKSNNPIDISNAIKKAIALTPSERKMLGVKGMDFINKKTVDHRSKEIFDFLEGVF